MRSFFCWAGESEVEDGITSETQMFMKSAKPASFWLGLVTL